MHHLDRNAHTAWAKDNGSIGYTAVIIKPRPSVAQRKRQAGLFSPVIVAFVIAAVLYTLACLTR